MGKARAFLQIPWMCRQVEIFMIGMGLRWYLMMGLGWTFHDIF